METFQPLTATNAAMRDHLAQVLGCLFFLNDHGCNVVRVDLGQSTPVVWIDDGERSPWIKGALRKRRVEQGVQMMVRVASVRGCLVSWIDRKTVTEQRA